MTVYALLWQLIKHILHGRGRDEVCVTVSWDHPDWSGAVAGTAVEFSWQSDADAFCFVEAVTADAPFSDSRETMPEWSS